MTCRNFFLASDFLLLLLLLLLLKRNWFKWRLTIKTLTGALYKVFRPTRTVSTVMYRTVQCYGLSKVSRRKDCRYRNVFIYIRLLTYLGRYTYSIKTGLETNAVSAYIVPTKHGEFLILSDVNFLIVVRFFHDRRIYLVKLLVTW